MGKRLDKLISGILIAGAIATSAVGSELEGKLKMKKTQNEKAAVYSRGIQSDLMNYSFVDPYQNLIYETTGSQSSQHEINNCIKKIESENTKTKIEIIRDGNQNYTFAYRNYGRNDLSPLEKKRIPNYEEFFREDTKNTHIYFIYPPTAELEIKSQEIEVLNNKTEKIRKLDTKDYEKTQLYETLSTVNDFLEIYEILKGKLDDGNQIDNYNVNNLAYNQEGETSLNSKLFRYLPEDNPQVKLAKKIPGKTGKILKGTIFLSKVLMNEVEKENRIKFWEKGINNDWKVKQMPLLNGESINLFQDNIISRKTSFNMKGGYDNFYLIISSLPYISGMTQTKTSGIEDVLIEIQK